MTKLRNRAVARPLAPWLWWGVILLMPVLSGGCVALNIPSVRYDDPEDHGGLFGPHRKSALHATPHAGEADGGVLVDAPAACATCVDDGLDEFGDDAPAKAAEVPWPRFHPLPTRPVFSSASGIGF
ncbi:MAG: hypothetical protein ACO1RT_02220 [Planctomycetaceae bacterium]